MQVLHFVQSLSKSSGGLGAAVLGISRSISSSDIKTKIFTYGKDANDIYSITKHDDIKIIKKFEFIKEFLKINLSLKTTLEEEISSLKNPIIHIHGMWTPFTYFAYLIASKLKIPYVFSPHGGLMPYALKKSHFKKILALKIYQKKILIDAELIITSSKEESISLSIFVKDKPIKAIPHGIIIPDKVYKKKSLKQNYRKKRCLFLGRINPSKGIKELIETWKKLNNKEWELIIAGIAEDLPYLNVIKKLSSQNKNNINIEFVGEVRGRKKNNLFKSSDLFVLPTKTENFGLVIAEAMAYGLPIITTKGAPWKVIKENNLGWWIETNDESLLIALKEATDMKSSDLIDIGNRARFYAKKNLNWEKMGLNYLQTYNLIKKV